jgi:hypothetical protein
VRYFTSPDEQVEYEIAHIFEDIISPPMTNDVELGNEKRFN